MNGGSTNNRERCPEQLMHQISTKFHQSRHLDLELHPIGAHLLAPPKTHSNTNIYDVNDEEQNSRKNAIIADIDDNMCTNVPASNDPAVRHTFSPKYEELMHGDSSVKLLHYLYESRIASMERYVAFCVVFHTMAKQCSSPWFKVPWDISRSQSNLRVATTGTTYYYISLSF